MNNSTQLEDGTKVKVNVNDEFSYVGEVVGKACTSMAETYIIRCTDGTIPNKTYNYSVSVAPLCLIRVLAEQ